MMEAENSTIPRKEYESLKKFKKVGSELLEDIARGINDIFNGGVKEI